MRDGQFIGLIARQTMFHLYRAAVAQWYTTCLIIKKTRILIPAAALLFLLSFYLLVIIKGGTA